MLPVSSQNVQSASATVAEDYERSEKKLSLSPSGVKNVPDRPASPANCVSPGGGKIGLPFCQSSPSGHDHAARARMGNRSSPGESADPISPILGGQGLASFAPKKLVDHLGQVSNHHQVGAASSANLSVSLTPFLNRENQKNASSSLATAASRPLPQFNMETPFSPTSSNISTSNHKNIHTPVWGTQYQPRFLVVDTPQSLRKDVAQANPQNVNVSMAELQLSANALDGERAPSPVVNVINESIESVEDSMAEVGFSLAMKDRESIQFQISVANDNPSVHPRGPFSKECWNHIVFGECLPGVKEIGGAHNKENFLKLLEGNGKVIGELPFVNTRGEEIEGLWTITYQRPKNDGKNGYHEPATKTVYDSKIISEEKYFEDGAAAFNQAQAKTASGWFAEVNGVLFEGYYRKTAYEESFVKVDAQEKTWDLSSDDSNVDRNVSSRDEDSHQTSSSSEGGRGMFQDKSQVADSFGDANESAFNGSGRADFDSMPTGTAQLNEEFQSQRQNRQVKEAEYPEKSFHLDVDKIDQVCTFYPVSAKRSNT